MTHHLHSNAAPSVHRHATHRSPASARKGCAHGEGRTGKRAVTAVRTPAPVGASPDGLPGPTPRRVRPPRWLDLRLLLGVLLVLGSVLLGARVIGAADATVPVWAAASDLAAGSRLTAADLVAVDVRLDRTAAAYLATGSRPEGRTLDRPVHAGELVPRSALAETAPLVDLALPVQAGYVPPSLT